MPYEFKTERIVEFAETDMAGILHFSNFFRYMEAAEHAFFRSLGLSVHSEAGGYGAARRSASCTFEQPLRYQDVVQIHVLVKEKRTRSIQYVVRFSKDGAEVARGEMAVVFVQADARQGIEAVSIPQEVHAVIEEAPADLLA